MKPPPRTRERESAQPRPEFWRRRVLALGALGLVVALVALIVLLGSGGGHGRSAAQTGTPGGKDDGAKSGRSGGSSSSSHLAAPGVYAVGLRILRLTDTSRTITLPDGTSAPRPLVTEVFYPALGAPGPAGAPATQDAAAASAKGQFPLIVFGHGFAVTPKLYAHLLEAWARAGYVVAAPLFPLENAQAPGGPDESDLVNQPADMHFVISSMLSLSQRSTGPLAGLISPAEIAVSGQSDGGDTALAVAYDGPYRDHRVGAAVILAGAEIPALGSFTFPQGGPPMLAAQGTADTVNLPSATEAFFTSAHRPKYLLSLIGAEHLPPYSTQQPQLTIVEQVTLGFLDHYLKHAASGLQSDADSGQRSRHRHSARRPLRGRGGAAASASLGPPVRAPVRHLAGILAICRRLPPRPLGRKGSSSDRGGAEQVRGERPDPRLPGLHLDADGQDDVRGEGDPVRAGAGSLRNRRTRRTASLSEDADPRGRRARADREPGHHRLSR